MAGVSEKNNSSDAGASPFAPVAELPEYAKTAEEWWQIADAIWPDIQAIFGRVGFDLWETKYAETIGPATDHERPFGENMAALRVARDVVLATWLERAWEAAPDRPYIHGWPSWHRFCDLCSESHVLDPEEAEGSAAEMSGPSNERPEGTPNPLTKATS